MAQSAIDRYCECFNTEETGPFNILVNGKPRYSDLTEAQAKMYWSGLNIFNGNTATLKNGRKIIARKGELS